MDNQPTLAENQNIQNSDESVLLDFSNFFKGNNQKPQLSSKQQTKENKVDSEIIQNNVPRNLTITQEEMKMRRCLDVRRWYCLSRPQYQRSCGISSVITVWNYLFSTLGVGSLQPISQEEVIVKLGLTQEVGPHFNKVEFGSFSGNMALIKWFKSLCRLHKVEGRAYIMWKQFGKDKTHGIDRDVALQKMEAGLRTDKFSYIYHAYDHYFCPIGYEITPNYGPEAYLRLDQIDLESAVHWIIIAEPAKPYPFFTVRKWIDMATDIELQLPKYTNIRKMDEGIKEYKSSFGDSQHCIMQFERVDPIVRIKQKKQQQKQNEEVSGIEKEKVNNEDLQKIVNEMQQNENEKENIQQNQIENIKKQSESEQEQIQPLNEENLSDEQYLEKTIEIINKSELQPELQQPELQEPELQLPELQINKLEELQDNQVDLQIDKLIQQ